ncbi:hypothetical protein Q4493_15420 [Colwellia sp. 1_MG-2023]|uniref:hypothetical protein n=1 Tax=Colwellia sp. 1_MG-2023 TaxID=3062649 RepID=UPI0026E3A259|nr:hypothetical protein [Colwellia sp. 1_MG-2023]MDO6447160.1 hypothetical protein [Colwellia sp. 1_MG-2023]
MSHDLYASWVTAELSSIFKSDTEILFRDQSITYSKITSFANRESGRVWPIPDGRVSLSVDSNEIEVALELKRTNEGLHGVLTATGQSQAYLKKGYDISVIAVPDQYDSYENPGLYLTELLDSVDPNSNIVVITYSPPDETKPSPFKGKLTIHRNISFDSNSVDSSRVREFNSTKASTQWAHLREGSSDAHCFFKYLQVAKSVSATESYSEAMYVAPELEAACNTINSNISAIKFLSNATGETLHDDIWRKYWFDYVVTPEMQVIWDTNPSGQKEPVNFESKLKSDVHTYKKFFGGRIDSTKNKLVNALNSCTTSIDVFNAGNGKTKEKVRQLVRDNKIDLSTIGFEELAWIIFAINIHHRAHSFREDIDSGLSHIGMLEDDGRPSDSGYRFVDISERTNDCYSGKAFQLYGKAILTEGQLASFLHYIHRISDEIFANDPLFSSERVIENDTIKFNHEEYLLAVKGVMADELCVINLAAERGGTSRKPFQAELAILQKLGITSSAGRKRFRLGGGLMINWPKLSEFLES